MSTSRSDNPFLGFSIRRARSPPNPPNSPEDGVFTEEAPLLQTRTTPAQPRPASSFLVFPIITPIMNPFAVGHPTGLQTITAHGPPSSGSTRDRTRRSNNPFNPAAPSIVPWLKMSHSRVQLDLAHSFLRVLSTRLLHELRPLWYHLRYHHDFRRLQFRPQYCLRYHLRRQPCRILSICSPRPLPNRSPRSSTNYSR